MTLLSLIVTIVLVGIVLYVINRFVPMQADVKRILNVAVVIVLIIWLLNGFGLFHLLDRPVTR